MSKRRPNHPTDAVSLALSLANRGETNAAFLLQQAEGRQRLKAKVPSWAENADLHFPPRLALEQCSSEATARYKASIAQRFLGSGQTMVDLTGGLGIDFSFIAPLFQRAIYVERQATLCDLARHNFPVLHLEQAEIYEGDAETYLQQMPSADFVFIDPARRDNIGRKVFLIADCTPSLPDLLPVLMQKAQTLLVKYSPMLDLTSALRTLLGVQELHVVEAAGECKEILFVIGHEAPTAPTSSDKSPEAPSVPTSSVINHEAPSSPTLFIKTDRTTISLPLGAEVQFPLRLAQELHPYLYEPGPAAMKAGIFRWLSAHFQATQLAPNTHLYTSPAPLPNFPGRAFALKDTFTFSKADLRRLRTQTDRASITVRNFPSTPEVLRRRLHLKDGGPLTLFATTLADGSHRLLLTERLG